MSPERRTSAPTVAVIAAGDMGHAVGGALRSRGARVTTSVAGRGERTLRRARQAGMELLGEDEDLVRTADIFLSIVPPAAALSLARRIAAAMRRAGAAPTYVDCNAVSPATAEAIGRTIADAGAPFVDAGIVGGPPRPDAAGPRVYASGPHVAALLSLRDYGLDVRPAGTGIGQASALKMSYAALTKGLAALGAELLAAARAGRVWDDLVAELQSSQPQLWQWLNRQLPGAPPKAHRWIAEMREIEQTFAAAGLPRATMAGAAELYELMAATPLGRDGPEPRRRAVTLEEVVDALDAARGRSSPAE